MFFKHNAYKDSTIISLDEPLGDWYENYDSVDLFLPYINITFYGVPIEFEDDEIDDLLEDNVDFSKFIQLGSISGYYIDWSGIVNRGDDVLVVCDDFSGDLSYIASSLLDDEGMIKTEFGDPTAYWFYLDNIFINKDFRNMGIGTRVMREFPKLLQYYTNFEPEVFVVYPQAVEKNTKGQLDRVEDEASGFRNNLRLVDKEKASDANSGFYKTLKLLEWLKKLGYQKISDTELMYISY